MAKKSKFLVGFLLLGSLIAGCSNGSVDTHADVSFGSEVITTNKGDNLTVAELYNYILENQNDAIAKTVLVKIMESELNLKNDQAMKNLYKKYLNNYFKETFVDGTSYKVNGEFSEDLLVKYLNSESYSIKCGAGFNAGDLDNTNFSCDYSDYIEKEVNYDIYVKMLKLKYLLNEKADLINKSNGRRVTSYTVAKGSDDNEVRELLETYAQSFVDNKDSTDETVIKNIEDVAEAKRKKDLEEVSEHYAYVSTSQDSSSGYTYLDKFTKCGDKRCSLEEGKEYQDKLIMDKEYFTTKVVISSNTDILYEDAREILFSDNVNDYLYEIGSEKYLMSPAYFEENDKRINDIVLYDSANSNYYFATVETINSLSSFDDKVAVAELLLDKVTDSIVFNYCYENLEIEIFDKDIREYFVSKYGDTDVE